MFVYFSLEDEEESDGERSTVDGAKKNEFHFQVFLSFPRKCIGNLL